MKAVISETQDGKVLLDRLKLKKLPEIEICCYWESEDKHLDYWKTDCGWFTYLDQSTPEDKGYIFCPHCGKKIKTHDQ